MADKSTIEWTDATWNVVRGCSRVSKGCEHCYAERVAHRFSGAGLPYAGLTDHKGRWNGTIKVVEEHMMDPLKWKRPRRIFVNSMSDLFHENLDFSVIAAIFGIMAACPQHTFQILTKRPARMLEFFAWLDSCSMVGWDSRRPTCVLAAAELLREEFAPYLRVANIAKWPLPNVWLGVSCEDQKTTDERIPLLLCTPAAVRWISAEPLLGPIDLQLYQRVPKACFFPWCGLEGKDCIDCANRGYVKRAIDWVVVGGESGKGARPMHPLWALSLRDQCLTAGVPFFFKQWGEYEWRASWDGEDLHRVGKHVFDDGTVSRRIRKWRASDLLAGRQWHEYPTAQRSLPKEDLCLTL